MLWGPGSLIMMGTGAKSPLVQLRGTRAGAYVSLTGLLELPHPVSCLCAPLRVCTRVREKSVLWGDPCPAMFLGQAGGGCCLGSSICCNSSGLPWTCSFLSQNKWSQHCDHSIPTLLIQWQRHGSENCNPCSAGILTAKYQSFRPKFLSFSLSSSSSLTPPIKNNWNVSKSFCNRVFESWWFYISWLLVFHFISVSSQEEFFLSPVCSTLSHVFVSLPLPLCSLSDRGTYLTHLNCCFSLCYLKFK